MIKQTDKRLPIKMRHWLEGYLDARKDIVSLIEARLSELLGDAQPTPILRYELRDLINKIKEDKNETD